MSRTGISATPEVTWRQKLQYGFDNTMSRGTPALVGWLALVTVVLVLIFTLDQLVYHRTGRSVFGQVGFFAGVIGLSAFEFAAFRRGVDPRVAALFAVALALLQLLVFQRAARSLPLPFDSTLKRAAAWSWAAISVVVPPAAILTAGYPQLALQCAWTITGVVPSFVLLKALERPGPRAASIETP